VALADGLVELFRSGNQSDGGGTGGSWGTGEGVLLRPQNRGLHWRAGELVSRNGLGEVYGRCAIGAASANGWRGSLLICVPKDVRGRSAKRSVTTTSRAAFTSLRTPIAPA
jgi:hypothetical protein